MNNGWRVALVVLAFLVVFVAGGAIGSVFTLHYAAPPPAPAAPAAPSKPEQFGPQLMQRFLKANNQLELTAAQREQIRVIVDDTAQILNDSEENLRRQTREAQHSGVLIIEHMQDQISAVLTPAQRIKFDVIIRNVRQRLQKYNQEQQRNRLGGPAAPARPVGGKPNRRRPNLRLFVVARWA